MVLFKDLTAQSDNVLSKGYIHEKPWAIELKHKLDNPTFCESASLSSSGLVACSSSANVALQDGGLVSGTLSADGSGALNATYPLKLFPFSLTLAALAKKSKKTPTSLDISCDLRKDLIHQKFTVSPVSYKFNSQTCFQYKYIDPRTNCPSGDLLTIGCDVNGQLDTRAATCSVGASWTRPVGEYQASGAVTVGPAAKSPFGKVKVAVAGKSPKAAGSEMAAEVVYQVPEDRTEVAFGASWFLDPKTRTTSMKARVDHQGKAAAAITHRISENFDLSIGAQFDLTRKLVTSTENDTATQFGVKLNLLA